MKRPIKGTVQSYRVFVRNWWREAGKGEAGTSATRLGLDAPIGMMVVPDSGARKTTIATGCTETEALAICEEYARTHKPGSLSRKAEYESE